MTTWDGRFRAGECPRDPDPTPLLVRYVRAPDGAAPAVSVGFPAGTWVTVPHIVNIQA